MLDGFLAGQKEGEGLMKDEVRRLTAELNGVKKGDAEVGENNSAEAADNTLQTKLRDKEEVRARILL